MEVDIKEFSSTLSSEVRERAGEAASDPSAAAAALTDLMLEYLSDNGIVENPSAASFNARIGRGTGKADGYAVSDDEDSIDIFATVYVGSPEPTKLPPEIIRRAVEQTVRYADAALKGLHKEIASDSDAFAMTTRIYELREKIDRIRVFIFTDGISGLIGKLPERKNEGISWRFEIWDCERLSRLLQSGLPQLDIDVDFEKIWTAAIPCVTLPPTVTEYQAHLAIIPGELLFRLYDEYGARLLEHNVRSFLQAKGKVNRGIRDTLRSEPGRFMAYNNGVSITAQEVELTALPSGQPAIKRVKGLQIVNGGQTTASIHRARKTDKADLSSVFVPAKISVICPELMDTLAPRIAQFANTQNLVQMADFSANDPFHIQLERLSKSIWMPGEQGKWFYERARGQYQVAQASEGTTQARLNKFKERTPSSRKFTKLDLAKYLNCWDQLPHQVSQGGQMNFVLFMQRMRETHAKNWLPDDAFYRDLISKAVLFRAATAIVRSEDFVAYRANIVAYLVAALAFRSGGRLDLKRVWDSQTTSTDLEALMRDWSHRVAGAIIASAAGRNITQWAKKIECWKAVMAADLPLPDRLPPEFQATVIEHRGWGNRPEETRVQIDPDEIDAISTCRSLETAEWIRILDWGQQTGNLDVAQRQVASTLAMLAAGGWQRNPSAKNAREGRKVINLARELGAFEEAPT